MASITWRSIFSAYAIERRAGGARSHRRWRFCGKHLAAPTHLQKIPMIETAYHAVRSFDWTALPHAP